LNAVQRLIALGNAAALCAPRLSTGALAWPARNRRTYVATTEPLDRTYTPAFPVAAQYQGHFRPTMVTDAAGRLAAEMSELAVAPVEVASFEPVRERVA